MSSFAPHLPIAMTANRAGAHAAGSSAAATARPVCSVVSARSVSAWHTAGSAVVGSDGSTAGARSCAAMISSCDR